jgi:uncharacterized protein involved in type VI secretion and phage assembly
MNLVDALSNKDEELSRKKRINGAAIGVVTNNKDPEGLGRVKIQFPWLAEDSEGDWVRIVSFMAGKNRGGVFFPEVGDEVLVIFEQGDIDYPYVIGSLWNDKDTPPETNQDGKNNIRKITSRSGHEIVFNDDDEQKKEKLEIHTKAGHKIILDDSAGQEKIEITDKTGSNKIAIDSVQNSINVESAMQLKIKANIVEIEGTSSLTLKSSAIVTIQGMPVKIN